METLGFAIAAFAVLAFGLVSGRVQRSILTLPIVAVLFGLAISEPVLGVAIFQLESEWIEILGELTLMLVLFTDASRIDLRRLVREHKIPVRLLAVGLPLTVVAGAVAAWWLFEDVGFWEAAVLAAVLAPTDAALGQAVVASREVPVRIRQALNVESGLNDGIALPAVLILVAVACASGAPESASSLIRLTALQVIVGPLCGIAVGYFGGKLVDSASRSGWMNHSFQSLAALGLSLLAFSGAQLIGGNGFLAAFFAGLALGNSWRGVCDCLYEFAEAEGQLLTLLIFLFFGVMMVPAALAQFSWSILLYAVLSLTLIRMLPVAVSLLGARLRPETVGFLGWFGPRGLASILFGLLVVDRSGMAHGGFVLNVAVTTVLLSVFSHGLTSRIGARWYGHRTASMADRGLEEHVTVSEMPVRISIPEEAGGG